MGLATIDPHSQSVDHVLQIPKFGVNRPNSNVRKIAI